MNNVDPDILYALKTVAGGGESQRVLNLKAKYEKRTEQQFETQLALLSDEVERVCPRNHPLFELVLILAVARKVERSQQEPEFQSFVDEGFPQGW
jgi:hypothetical protein